MKIVLSEQSPTDPNLLQTVTAAWQVHPLRSPAIDQLLTTVTLVVEEVEDGYGFNPDDHPKYRLMCAPSSPYVSIPPHQAILHELTHLIDRFDPKFSGARTPEQVTVLINGIPVGDANESVKRAFNAYWNAYIDGRLERRGIIVHTLEDRIDEKLGRRMQEKEVLPGERESIEGVWNQDSCTLDYLIKLAIRYPNRRAKKDWIKYPHRRA